MLFDKVKDPRNNIGDQFDNTQRPWQQFEITSGLQQALAKSLFFCNHLQTMNYCACLFYDL